MILSLAHVFSWINQGGSWDTIYQPLFYEYFQIHVYCVGTEPVAMFCLAGIDPPIHLFG